MNRKIDTFEIPDASLVNAEGLEQEELKEIIEKADPSLVRELNWRLTARPSQVLPEKGWTTAIMRMGRGSGKRLWTETPILTSYGFKTMGTIQEGDVVFDEKGEQCKVTYVSPIETKPAYKVCFSDGTHLYADPEHLWVTLNHYEKRKISQSETPYDIPTNWANKNPLTTQQIKDTLRYGKHQQLEHSIPLAKPLQMPEAKLPIEPYVLGVWLGDGANKTAEVANPEQEIRDHIEALGVITKTVKQTPDKCPRYTLGEIEINGRRQHKVSRQLREMNLLHNKHIPKQYLHASEKQRLELLKGLMDTDGGYEKGNKVVSFMSTDKQLAQDVLLLVRSLGMKPTLTKKQGRLYGVDKKMAYRVNYSANTQVFNLTRKAERLKFNGKQALRSKHRMVINIEQAGDLPMRCISVDSSNAMYLAGEELIPTHNTRLAAEWVRRKIEIEGCKSGLIVGSTTAKVVDVMVEGPSGILACCPDAVYKVNKNQIVWPNGAKLYIQTAEKKEGARGYSVEFVWADEFCEWKYERETWGNVIATVREKGADGQSTSQKLITTTPKRTTLLKEIENKTKDVLVRTGSTYENRDNLTEEYLDELEATWGGTSLYRQEVLGEYLEQVEGAIWLEEWIKHLDTEEDVDYYTKEFEYDKIVVAIDPAISVSKDSDETGLVVVAKAADEYFVLEDLSGKMHPDVWATKAIDRALKYGCEIIVEDNQGGALTKKNLTDKNSYVRVKQIRAVTSKEDRLGSAAIFYERGQVTHIYDFKELESQMVSWVPPTPGHPQKESPDRADALSHAIRYLSGKRGSINQIAIPTRKKRFTEGDFPNDDFTSRRRTPKRSLSTNKKARKDQRHGIRFLDD
jgi:phage terminase large subunit-like protein